MGLIYDRSETKEKITLSYSLTRLLIVAIPIYILAFWVFVYYPSNLFAFLVLLAILGIYLMPVLKYSREQQEFLKKGAYVKGYWEGETLNKRYVTEIYKKIPNKNRTKFSKTKPA